MHFMRILKKLRLRNHYATLAAHKTTVPDVALNNYHVDRILFLIGHDKRLRNYESYVILTVRYSEIQL